MSHSSLGAGSLKDYRRIDDSRVVLQEYSGIIEVINIANGQKERHISGPQACPSARQKAHGVANGRRAERAVFAQTCLTSWIIDPSTTQSLALCYEFRGGTYRYGAAFSQNISNPMS
jgi:hypothetical protein